MEIPFLSLKESNSKYEFFLKQAFADFLETGHYMLGKNVLNFEKKFAKYCDSIHCIGVANGLDALTLIIKSFDFPPNSEIIVPANTYFATILSIKNAGFKPILAEPSIHDYLVDVAAISKLINKNTVAIMAVNLYGRMCDFDKISKVCEQNNLKLIVDAAQSHGAVYKKSKNCFGVDATAYSFYPTKNLGALSDAGAVVTESQNITDLIRKNRNYGSEIKYEFDTLGTNSRLSELQAAFLNIKLDFLDQEIEKRRQIAKCYLGEIINSKITLPPNDRIDDDAWHLFVIRTENRKGLIEYLQSKKIGYDIHYPIPPHKQKALPELNHINLPITEKIHETILSLPMNSNLTDLEVDYIINSLNSF